MSLPGVQKLYRNGFAGAPHLAAASGADEMSTEVACCAVGLVAPELEAASEAETTIRIMRPTAAATASSLLGSWRIGLGVSLGMFHASTPP